MKGKVGLDKYVTPHGFWDVFVTTSVLAVGIIVINWLRLSEVLGETAYFIALFVGLVGSESARIALALIICSVVVWVADIPKLMKLIPFVWIMVEYGLWIVKSLQLRSFSEDLSQYQGRLYLYGASWWDIVTLVSVILCLFCLVKKRPFNFIESH